MLLTLPSVLMTIVFGTIMITVLLYFLRPGKIMYSIRSDLLFALIFIIAIRLLFPVELPFTRTLRVPKLINPINEFLNTKLVGNFSVMYLLIVIWLIGCVVQTIRFLRQFRLISQVFTELEPAATKKHLSDFFEIDKVHDYPVWISDMVSSPMVLGFRNIILLPELDLSHEDMERVLKHEMEHVRHHDNWLKLALNVLMIIYWWYPPVYALCNKVQTVLEIRTDEHAASEFSKENELDFAETLVRVNRVLDTSKHSKTALVSSHFTLVDSDSQLKQRILYLTRNQYSKAMNIFVLCIITLLPVISYSFVLNPVYQPPREDGVFNPRNPGDAFLVLHKDGTYTLYFDDGVMDFEKLESGLANLPIIVENE
ncbi:MAG: M56 family metallopeptidase [Allobaculum sp.]